MDPNDTTLQNALDADIWETVERRLLTKMLEEFTYEEIISPRKVKTGDDRAIYCFDLGNASYRFAAAERLMDSLHIYNDTIERRTNETWKGLGDPLSLLRDLGEATNLDGLTEGNLVREYKRTLLADAHIEARKQEREGFDPTNLDYAHLEGEMAGHPWITYNKGRLGWGYDDYREYAPERKEPVTLSWAAVSKENAAFVGTEDVTHDSLVQRELGDYYDGFRDRLASQGLDPDAYYLLPVHDWQWENSIGSSHQVCVAA